MTLMVMGKVKSKVTIGLPGKNPTTLIQIIFLCDAYFSNYPVPELLTHPVYIKNIDYIHGWPFYGTHPNFSVGRADTKK